MKKSELIARYGIEARKAEERREAKRRFDEALAPVLRLVARREQLKAARLRCPRCGSAQVQLRDWLVQPALWRCREAACRHGWSAETQGQAREGRNIMSTERLNNLNQLRRGALRALPVEELRRALAAVPGELLVCVNSIGNLAFYDERASAFAGFLDLRSGEVDLIPEAERKIAPAKP